MSCTITHERLFDQWCKRRCEPEDLAQSLGITPARLAELTADPAFVRRVAAWETVTRAYREGVIFDHLNATASKLREAMKSADPVEARRIAIVMARLCQHMFMPCAPVSPRPKDARSQPAKDAPITVPPLPAPRIPEPPAPPLPPAVAIPQRVAASSTQSIATLAGGILARASSP